MPTNQDATPPTRARARADLIGRYTGRRSVTWLAWRLGLAERTVVNMVYREGYTPTHRDDLLTTTHAADLLGVTPQAVSGRCRRGTVQAWRNPTGDPRWGQRRGRWWLIPRTEVTRLIASGRYPGARRDDPRLTERSAWPGVVCARRGERRVG